MSGKIKSLVSDSLIYGLSGIISRFISIFLIPLYTRVFTPGDYGTIGLLTSGIAFISILTTLAMDNSTARWFYDTNDERNRKVTINTWFWFYLFTCVVAMLLIFLLSPLINKTLLNNMDSGVACIMLLAGTLPFSMMTAVANNVLRFERKAIPTVMLSLLVTLLSIGFNLLFVIFLKVGLIGVFYSSLLSQVIGSFFAYFLMRRWITSPLSYDFPRLKKMLAYSWPFIPASLAIWIVNLSGVFFINGFKEKTDVGLYQIGVALASILGMVTNAFQQAWAPFAYSIINDDDARSVYARVFDFYVLLFSFGCIGVALFGKEVLIILTQPEYYGAYDVATVLSYSYLFIGLVSIADLGLSITKNTKPLGFIMTISAGLIVLLNLTFIPLWGRIGAAFALCLSQSVNPVYMFYRSQKAYFIPFNFKKAGLVVACSVSISFISVRYLQSFTLLTGVSIKLGVLVLFTALIALIYRRSVIILIGKYASRKK